MKWMSVVQRSSIGWVAVALGVTLIGCGTTTSDSSHSSVKPQGTRQAKPFDFDGDGRANPAVFRPSDSTWYVADQRDGVSPVSGAWGLRGDWLTPADFDGDGVTDFAVYRPSNTYFYAQPSSNRFGVITRTFPGGIPAGVWPAPADYDGDGKAEIAYFNPTAGHYRMLLTSNNQIREVVLGNASSLPVPGQYTNDQVADVAVFDANSGQWTIIDSRTGQALEVRFGLAGDRPVPADYDGDGQTDLAVVRAENGGLRWYVQYSTGGVLYGAAWGLAIDQVVPADYDGDGKTDLAVYRYTDRTWYVSQSSTSQLRAINFGAGADIPATYAPQNASGPVPSSEPLASLYGCYYLQIIEPPYPLRPDPTDDPWPQPRWILFETFTRTEHDYQPQGSAGGTYTVVTDRFGNITLRFITGSYKDRVVGAFAQYDTAFDHIYLDFNDAPEASGMTCTPNAVTPLRPPAK